MTDVKTQKTKSRNGYTKKYNTGAFATRMWKSLYEDFSLLHGPQFASKAASAFEAGIEEFRGFSFPELGFIPPSRFAAWKQLESLLKKFTFAHDAMKSEDRTSKTIQVYHATQLRICRGIQRSESVHRVVQEARKLARSILGEYSEDDCINLGHFGKKSSIGCSLANAYVDYKLTCPSAFTGSLSCGTWFLEKVVPKSAQLQRLIKRFELFSDLTLSTDVLKLVCVPKKWNVDRGITPLALLDLFYSFGYGELVTARLKEKGLDISRLQHQHRKLMKEFSISCSHVTADLSSASDSITSELLNMVLPRKWYCALKPLFCRKIEVEGSIMYTGSVLPMGNGATFPLETLVFYCITKAIGNLTRTGGTFSVYGDDLIYPRRIHKYVAWVFPQIHLTLNLDKTFSEYPFRESCGEDYYRGAPVRPFCLEGEERDLTCRKYQAFLYGAFNGLLRRWDEFSIAKTCQLFFDEFSRLGKSHLVPPSYPDTSGIKVADPFRNSIPWYIPRETIRIIGGARYYCASTKRGCMLLPTNSDCLKCQEKCLGASRTYCFSYLRETPKDRFVIDHEPYLYLALQGQDDEVIDFSTFPFWETDFSEYFERDLKRLARKGSSRTLTSWRTVPFVKTFRSKTGELRKVRDVKVKAAVASRMEVTARPEPGHVSDWI